jgi:hypothetical protein
MSVTPIMSGIGALVRGNFTRCDRQSKRRVMRLSMLRSRFSCILRQRPHRISNPRTPAHNGTYAHPIRPCMLPDQSQNAIITKRVDVLTTPRNSV